MTKKHLIPVKQVILYLTEEDQRELKLSAIDRKTSVSEIVREIVKEYLEKQKELVSTR